MSYTPGVYIGMERVVKNNMVYIANLTALMQWYIHVRSQFISDDFPDALLDCLKEKLNMAIRERIKRLELLCLQKETRLSNKWPAMEADLISRQNSQGDTGLRDAFLEKIAAGIENFGKDYITVIKNLKDGDAEIGTRWLQGIVEG